jgi:hypothetical protein
MKRGICISSIAVSVLMLVLAFGCNKNDSNDDSDDTDTTAAPLYTVGQSTGGGVVFYVDGTGNHGLVAATSDQSTSCTWGCMGTQISGAVDSVVGCGQTNTTAIITTCTAAGIAAKICSDLTLNSYSDWFLPSKLELALMYAQKSVIGGFSTYGYWSSTQFGNGTAWVQYFSNGSKSTANKGDAYRVRAIRAI